ncbi:alpha/beta fold hydrolase [Aestuariibacter salexigens]|uniref:alpha/beta fold hydrolase n=1 Tax=Aestuariibacter salexigens TaxID=226010 RepID=UPI000417FD30|nr:alpha/beta hydrolase [Aestuariibacter salexigens]
MNTQPEKHRIVSDDGVKLAVFTTGKPNGLPVLFLHGTCSSHRIWQRQFACPLLTEDLFLIAPDLRGHGESEQPTSRKYYSDGISWAGDINAILNHFDIDYANVVAWSYGGRVINDYLLHFGEQRIAGINFIAAGTLSTAAVKGPGYKTLAQLFSDDAAVRKSAEETFVDDLCVGDRSMRKEILEDVQKTSLKTRLYMRDRVMKYEDMLSALTCPVLLTHGRKDHYSLPLLADMLNRHIPHTRLSWYENEGHMPFFHSHERFNRELYEFANRRGVPRKEA